MLASAARHQRGRSSASRSAPTASALAAAIALHLPLELAALSLAGGAYMQASKQPLGARALARVAALCALLLACAATLETYRPPGGLR